MGHSKTDGASDERKGDQFTRHNHHQRILWGKQTDPIHALVSSD